MSLRGAFGHFKTITKHRHAVIRHCKKAGILWQGLRHDLSKYAPAEFFAGARYYVGTRSPNELERKEHGYSLAWMHHKGRNKHHFEYWTDISAETRQYAPLPMPRKYLVEMVMDRRAACMTYEGEAYTDGSALAYLRKSQERFRMNPQTLRELDYLLEMLQEQGEKKTFAYLKSHILKGKPFPWEQT